MDNKKKNIVKDNLTKKKNKRRLKGFIIKNIMNKTVVVEVKRLKETPKYMKRVFTSNKFKCHDEKNQYKVGDQVIVEECRPLSKEKRWRVIKKLIN